MSKLVVSSSQARPAESTAWHRARQHQDRAAIMISQTPIFSIRAEVADIRHFGQTPYGERRVVDILGGRVEGPRLQGRILPGADWQVCGATALPVSRRAMASRPMPARAFSCAAMACATVRPR